MKTDEVTALALQKLLGVIEEIPASTEATNATVLAAEIRTAVDPTVHCDVREQARIRICSEINTPSKGSTETFDYEHLSDSKGNPAGGSSVATGIDTQWQNGPLVSKEGEKLAQNGAFVQTLIEIAINRLEYYQSTKFTCEENASALRKLRGSLVDLDSRHNRRSKEGVSGTHHEDADKEHTISLTRPSGAVEQICCSDFYKLKQSGMLFELFPDAPQEFPKL